VGRQAAGTGGEIAPGDHRQVTASAIRNLPRVVLDCAGCSRPITGEAVVIQGRLYCTWDCAVSAAGLIPGHYFG
jgi:hypothetical protein